MFSMKDFKHNTWKRFGCLIRTNTVKVISNSVPKDDDPPIQFLESGETQMIKMSLFRDLQVNNE